jgi:hypothetical protein
VAPLVLLATALAGCDVGPSGSAAPARRPAPTPCASRTATPSPRPTPYATKLAWRAEERADGSVRMTVGDVAAAPEDPKAVRVTSYRAPDTVSACDAYRIEKVHGWWCSTTVAAVQVDGEIVVGDAQPRARLTSTGFATRCHGRPGRVRQVYGFDRDSWSGWRDYSHPQHTGWTAEQRQRSGALSAACPQGRTGTYDYRLAVRLEIEGVTVGDSWAHSAPLRTDCGTGVS